ncbi:MAG: glycoside hydrolase domain-containing protein [Promethearchaeota archaeon]
MLKVKYYSYEIASSSLGISLIFLFGTLSLFPKEIMLMGDGQTWFYALSIFTIGIWCGFIFLSLLKSKFTLILMRISDVLICIIAAILVSVYLWFTKDMMESWIVQGAWFLRYNGVLVGIFLGLISFKTIAGISFLIKKLNESESESESAKSLARLRTVVFLITFLSFSFYIIEIIMYRYLTLLYVFITIFIIQLILLPISVLLFGNLKYRELGLINLKDIDIAKNNINVKKRKLIEKLNRRLIHSNTDKSDFWWLFFPLSFAVILSICVIVLYPFNLMVSFSFPWQNSTVSATIPLIQLLGYLQLLIVFFSIIFLTAGSRAKRKYEPFFRGRKLHHLKRSTLGFLDAGKFLGLWLVINLLIYFYDYPLFYPKIVSLYLFFGLIGALIYFIIGRSEKSRQLLYLIAIIVLIINLGLIYQDGMYNYENYYDGEFEITFPFKYLHSWQNLLSVGICVGILISDLLLNFTFRYTDGGDSINRSALIISACFLGGLLSTPAFWLINNPGGDPPLTDQTNEIFFWFCLGLALILLIGYGINHMISDIIFPLVRKTKLSNENINSEEKNKTRNILKAKRNPKALTNNTPNHRQKKVIAISLSIIVVIAALGGVLIYFSFRENYKKPILIYSPGNYYIWLQNASERVGRKTEICLESSPRIDAVELKLAKNEYGAFQLVWHLLGEPIKSLTYNISDFVNKDDNSQIIGANYSNLRLEEYIIENEFPDVLLPFNRIDLTRKQNYIFWFSIKTPYNIKAGTYEGQIEFKFNGDKSEKININLKIWDFAVPKMRHLRTNIGGHHYEDDIVNNYLYHRMNDYGVPIRAASNINQLGSPGGYVCYWNDTSKEWIFNWTWWDNKTQYKLNGGMNAFTVQYPLGIADGRVPYINDDDRMSKMKKWLEGMQSHMIAKGWLNYCYYYFIDEFQMFIPEEYDSRADYFADLKILLKAMKEAAPKIKIMTTTPPTAELEDLRDYIDIYCPVSYDRDKERWDDRIKAGREFWMYACVGPMAPWPNSHLYNRLYECRILLWQCWLYGLHGFLYWSSTAYYHGQYGIGYNGWGDGWFIYYRNGNYYDSLRWENYLMAQQDFEYLWLLKATIDYLKDNPEIISEKDIENYENELENIINTVVGEKWVYCDHPSIVYNAREQIGNMLDNLSEKVNLTNIGEKKWTEYM